MIGVVMLVVVLILIGGMNYLECLLFLGCCMVRDNRIVHSVGSCLYIYTYINAVWERSNEAYHIGSRLLE